MKYSDKEMTESNNPPLKADGKLKNYMQFMKFLRILNKQQVNLLEGVVGERGDWEQVGRVVRRGQTGHCRLCTRVVDGGV